MPRSVKAASFEDFLEAPARLAKQKTEATNRKTTSTIPVASAEKGKQASSHGKKQSKAPSHKEKVGLTIDSDIIDAIDDYIYHARKQGRRLKKNDVYEAALRQFLGLDGGGTL